MSWLIIHISHITQKNKNKKNCNSSQPNFIEMYQLNFLRDDFPCKKKLDLISPPLFKR